jgi:hypothetical protein
MSNTSESAPVGVVVPCLTPNSVASCGGQSRLLIQCCCERTELSAAQLTQPCLSASVLLYGSGDGSTTFNLPDYQRSLFACPRGYATLSNLRGTRLLCYGTDDYFRFT